MRSEPILARTEDSLRLKRTFVIVSVDVGNVRFETGALLVRMGKPVYESNRRKEHTSFRPIFERDLMRWQTEDLTSGDLLSLEHV